jgi:hypothetical protein
MIEKPTYCPRCCAQDEGARCCLLCGLPGPGRADGLVWRCAACRHAPRECDDCRRADAAMRSGRLCACCGLALTTRGTCEDCRRQTQIDPTYPARMAAEDR